MFFLGAGNNRPLATVPPRESSSSSSTSQHQRSQERKDKDRSRERDKARDKDKERDKQQRRAERDESELSRCSSDPANSQKSNRKLTVNLPSESTAVRGVKVHAVSPLSYSGAVHESATTPIDIDKVEQSAATQPPEQAAPTTADRVKVHGQFSYSALEAMAMLRNRITSPVVPVAAVAAQEADPVDEDKKSGDSIPLDLSDSSLVSDESRQVQQQQLQASPPASPPPSDGYPFSSGACVAEMRADRVTSDQEQIRSVLDLRVERWRLKKEKRRKADQVDNGVSDAEDVDDLDEEVSQLNLGLTPLNVAASSFNAVHGWPSVIGEEQLNFLCLFGLITPQQRNGNEPSAEPSARGAALTCKCCDCFEYLSVCVVPAGFSHFADCELMKCMKRHNILRDPTPTPLVETCEEDSATQLLKERTTLALTHCSQQLPSDLRVKDEQPSESQVHFARSLALLPRDPCDKNSTRPKLNVPGVFRRKLTLFFSSAF